MRLPLKDGAEYEIGEDLMDAYRLAYPMLDVGEQVAKMRLWLELNKASRPKNGARFVRNWLQRQTEIERYCNPLKTLKNDPSYRPYTGYQASKQAVIASLTGNNQERTIDQPNSTPASIG